MDVAAIVVVVVTVVVVVVAAVVVVVVFSRWCYLNCISARKLHQVGCRKKKEKKSFYDRQQLKGSQHRRLPTTGQNFPIVQISNSTSSSITVYREHN